MLLFSCANSTTVRKETWACNGTDKKAVANASANPTRIGVDVVRGLNPVFKNELPINFSLCPSKFEVERRLVVVREGECCGLFALSAGGIAKLFFETRQADMRFECGPIFRFG